MSERPGWKSAIDLYLHEQHEMSWESARKATDDIHDLLAMTMDSPAMAQMMHTLNPCEQHDYTDSCRQANMAEAEMILEAAWKGFIYEEDPIQRDN